MTGIQYLRIKLSLLNPKISSLRTWSALINYYKWLLGVGNTVFMSLENFVNLEMLTSNDSMEQACQNLFVNKPLSTRQVSIGSHGKKRRHGRNLPRASIQYQKILGNIRNLLLERKVLQTDKFNTKC